MKHNNEWTNRAQSRTVGSDIRAELEAEYSAKLEKAELSYKDQLNKNEQIAYEGYSQALGIITNLQERLKEKNIASNYELPDNSPILAARNLIASDPMKTIMDLQAKIDNMRAEYDKQIEEGYEEAYQMLLEERNKTTNLETVLYEEYDRKLAEFKTYMVDKIDQYLNFKWQELNQAGHENSKELLAAWRAAVPASFMVEEATSEELKEIPAASWGGNSEKEEDKTSVQSENIMGSVMTGGLLKDLKADKEGLKSIGIDLDLIEDEQ